MLFFGCVTKQELYGTTFIATKKLDKTRYWDSKRLMSDYSVVTTSLQRIIHLQINNKEAGLDTIASEILKAEGPAREERRYLPIKKIWVAEKMSQEWHLYRGITILSDAYKVFSEVVYMRPKNYAEEILNEYQCSFRLNRSTTDQIYQKRQTLEKPYEYGIDLHYLFVNYKQASDNVSRNRIL
ncbi:hypothetical protein EVAR_639_1 [Eumeta japonica]|uniref:Uncharacterized protein n=1 Tax=Eumeta variegata TaxID=151549 RepID=A0A4C1SB94_EUMVA|nr:hypothetical protein EVAR_639_1 [Eumeta japonica]